MKHIVAVWSALLLGILGCPADGYAQVHEPRRFERLQAPQGLSHNTVLAILQDRQGFLWIGTADGLNRFDGYAFVVYRHDPADSTSLAHNTVRTLMEDAAGRLWVGTEYGLNVFDPATETFTRHRLDGPSDRLHTVIGLSEGESGTLWVGQAFGLLQYDPRTGQSRRFDTPPAGFSTVSRDPGGAFWLGTLETSGRIGLYRFDPQDRRFAHVPLPAAWGAYRGVNVVAGASGRVWIEASPAATGRFDPATGRFHTLPDSLNGEVLYEDRQGALWLERTDGLWRYDPAADHAERFVLDPTGTDALARDVRVLYEDRAGTLWAGTLRGLYRLDPHRKPFRHLHHDPGDPGSLSSNAVMAVQADGEGTLWVGTLGGGLNRMDRRTGETVRYRRRSGDPPGLCDDNVWALHFDRHGALWVGTEAGLCRFDPRTRRFTRHAAPRSALPYVYALAEDAEGALWVGGWTVSRLNPSSGSLDVYDLLPADPVADTVHNVQAVYPDPAGPVWVGTEFNGLGRLDPATGAFSGYPFATDRPDGMLGRAVRFIHPDADGHTLWLGTDVGLVRFDSRTGLFRHYLPRDGLPGSAVFGILPDEAGRLWVSTNQGLARFDPMRARFTVYDAADGTGNTEFNRRAAFRSPEGDLFFGGLNGITAFRPGAIRDNPVIPPVVITRVFTSTRDGTRPHNPAGVDALVLQRRDASFEFEFAALGFTNPARQRYAYRLDGFDAAWVDAGYRRRARYTNVPPGRYVFRVRGSNEDGLWNEEGVALRVVMRPAFWQTWWFRLGVLAAVAGLLAAGYRYRVAHLLRVERLRMRIAGDLHDDIGSKLSSIALMSEMASKRVPAQSRERRQLTEITRSARGMVDDLRDIVWMVNPQYDGLGNLVSKMEHAAPTLLGDIPYTFESPPGAFAAPLDIERRRHVYLLYKELLTNVVRHARASRVAVRVVQEGDTFVVEVRDDGVGFEPAAPHAGNGLLSLQERAREVGGTLSFYSAPGAGTTATFRLRMA